MLPRRYSFIVADRSSGAVHRFTLAIRPTVTLLAALLALPIGWTVQSHVRTASQIERLQLRNATLSVENAEYRSATTALSSRITAVQLVIGELRDSAVVDPQVRRAMGRLPEADTAYGAALRSVALSSPTETFNLLDDVLNVLGVQLTKAADGVLWQQAFADATPLNLPTDGRVSGGFGYRPDPFTGERTLHDAIDISTAYGQPVYATADGTVASAAWSGDYGNLIKIDHGFGVVSGYGHLSKFAATAGSTVRRGDVIGYAGATGRATGVHVHYGVWVDSRAMNPLHLGTIPPVQSAN